MQQMFPTLADYPVERLELLVPVAPNSDEWGKVMDVSWSGFLDRPPERLIVQIEDNPGDAERSECGAAIQ